MTFLEIAKRTSVYLGDSKNRRWSETQIKVFVNRGYVRTAARVGVVQNSTPIPFVSDSPYYDLRQAIPDYYAVNGVYNFRTNSWVQFVSEKDLNSVRWDWERWTGENPSWGLILDWGKIGLFPYSTNASGEFLLWYKARPQKMIADEEIPLIPEGFHTMLVDYAAAEALASDRERIKSSQFYQNYYSQYDALEEEVQRVAKYDKDFVLEPYLALQRYGGSS